ncbi:hypothetical protein PI124_g1435 [Phytophthora idaei]|nr:hypothetical protein PI124_g1435 [Phytophthora idaei]
MPNSTQYESDGDIVMQAAHQPVFEFFRPPELGEWSQDALVTWKKKREQYEEAIRQRCVESGECPEVAMRPVKLSIEPKLLEVLCFLFEGSTVQVILQEAPKQIDKDTRTHNHEANSDIVSTYLGAASADDRPEVLNTLAEMVHASAESRSITSFLADKL